MNMIAKSSQRFLWAVYIFFILTTWVLLQKNIIFSPDVGYLLHATYQLMHGGQYGKEIFETNPPMILYLYMPIQWMAQYFSMHVILVARIYVFSLMVLSVGLSFLLLKNYFSDKSHTAFSSLLAVTIFIFFVLPMIAFAQREHLLLIFFVPYVFNVALLLDNKKVNPLLRLIIGVSAGLVFALKPYFLPALCFIELLIIFKKRSVFAWMRIESLSVIIVLGIYTLSLFVYQFEYIHTILPLINAYYFPVVKQSWRVIFSKPYIFFCVTVFVLYPFCFKKDAYRSLNIVLWSALLGMMVAFLLPRNNWYYHVLPAMGMALLLITSMMTVEFHNKGILAVLMLVFAYFFIHWVVLVQDAISFSREDTSKHLVKLMNQFSGEKTMSCFTTVGTSSCFPAIYAIHQGTYKGRFPFFWWYRGLMTKQDDSSRLKNDRNYVMMLIANDLKNDQPRWVVVDTRKLNRISLPFLEVFAQNKIFNEAWQKYHYYTSIDNYQIYIRNT